MKRMEKSYQATGVRNGGAKVEGRFTIERDEGGFTSEAFYVDEGGEYEEIYGFVPHCNPDVPAHYCRYVDGKRDEINFIWQVEKGRKLQ